MKKWIYWTLAIVAILVLASYFLFFKKKAPAYETYEVLRQDLIQTVSVTGELKSETDLNLNFEANGRIKKINAKVGTQVAIGDVLGLIDDQTLSAQVTLAKANLDKALAVSGLSNEQIDRTETEVANAKRVLDDTKDLEDQKKSANEKAVSNAKDSYNDAKSYYEEVVSEQGADSSQAKNAKLVLTNAQNALNASEETRKIAKKSQDLNETYAENSVKSAEKSLKIAQSKNQKAFENADVKVAQAQYEIALANLNKANLLAPVNGKITKINFKVGEISPLSNTNPFISMLSSDYLIEADVPESDIAKIQVQQTAKATFDALSSDEEFLLEVVSVEPASTVIQDVVYYKVKFVFKNSLDIRLKPGMTANIDVITNKKEKVIAVAQRLITETGTQRFVEVLNSDAKTTQKREVKLGIRGDEGLVEIVSGLKEGEKVTTIVTK